MSETLNTSVGGRQTLDSVIIANDCLDSRIMSMVSGLICNLDIKMANEHVDGEALPYLFGRMGFGVKWRSWIESCITIVRFSVLVNSSPTSFFF